MKDQKTAIVTGGAQGIGLMIAQILAAEYRVIAVDKDAEAIEECSRGSKKDGIDFTVCNITDESSIHKLVDTIMKKYGRIDLLVNNAAISANKISG